MKKWIWVIMGASGLLFLLWLAVVILAATYDYNQLKPLVTKAVRDRTGRELAINGDIRLKIGLRPELRVADVDLQNTPWASRPKMVAVKNLEVGVALLPLLKKSIQIDRLLLQEAEVFIEIDASGKSNLNFKPAESTHGDTPDDGYRLTAVREVVFENGNLTVIDNRTRKTDHLVLTRLDLRSKGFGTGADVSLEAAWNDIPIFIDGRIGTFKDIRERKAPWPLDLTLKALQSDITVKGQVGNLPELSGIDLQVNAEGEDLAQLGTLLGEPLPLKGRFRAAGRLLAPSASDISISGLRIDLENNTVQGELRAEQGAGKPRVSGRLGAERLDLRNLLAREKKKSGTTALSDTPAEHSRRVFSDAPFETKRLQQLDLELDVQVARLLLPQLALDQLHAVIKLSDGRLVFDPLTANAGGAPLKGKLALAGQARQATVAADLAADGIDLGIMAKALEAEKISGRLGIDFHGGGLGKSIAGILGSLNGELMVSLKDTRIPLRYLNLLGADMVTSFTRNLGPGAKQSETAAIHCLVGAFTIDDGLAKTDVLVADTQSVTLSGAGIINLKSEALKLGIETRSKEGFGTKATGKVSVDLGRVTKVFQLTGTLSEPVFGLSTGKSLEALAEAAGLTFLMGPVGLAKLFLSRADSTADPCAAALAKAKKSPGTQESAPKAGTTQNEGFGSRLRNLFR
jgi:uncharacterized protein involved in outer membrane biogenesis